MCLTLDSHPSGYYALANESRGADPPPAQPGQRGGKPSTAAPNHLRQRFGVRDPNDTCVAGITCIQTHERWLHLAVVSDLFCRQSISWTMQTRIDRELAISALLMVISRRQPKQTVTVNSDQEPQFATCDWQNLLAAYNLLPSMSHRVTVMPMT
jgi:putative transposase